MTEQNLHSILNELSELRSRVAQLEAEAADEMGDAPISGNGHVGFTSRTMQRLGSFSA